MNATTVRACLCNPGYVWDANGATSTCRPCNSGDAEAQGCTAKPPRVLLHNLTQTNVNKISPSQQLTLRSQIALYYTDTKVVLQWQVWKQTLASDTLVDLTGRLLSTATGPNLVISPGTLVPAGSYRIRLTATQGQSFGTAELTFSTNSPPTNGTFTVSPRFGMSLTDKFMLSARAWIDEDAPLSYRFYRVRATQIIPLSSSSSLPELNNLDLPAERNVSYNVSVRVSDLYGAAVESRAAVLVMPYVPADSWDKAVSDMIDAASLNGSDSEADGANWKMVQTLSTLSANLNSATKSTDDVANTAMNSARSTLVKALLQTQTATSSSAHSDRPMDEGVVAHVAACLVEMTAKPTQLSPDTVSDVIGLLLSLSGKNAPKRFSETTAQSMASAAGNTVVATNDQTRGSGADGEATAAGYKVNQMLEVLTYTAAAVSQTMAPGQQSVQYIETPAFAMTVTAIQPKANATIEVGGGVAVLPGALGRKVGRNLQQVGVHVVKWDENPFAFGTASSTTVGNATQRSLATGVVTLTLSLGGKELEIDGLDADPVMITMQTPVNEDSLWCDCIDTYDLSFGGGACAALVEQGYVCDRHFCNTSTCQYANFCDKTCNLCNSGNVSSNCTLAPQIECMHWNESLADWVSDGRLMSHNRSTGEIVCAYTHLTSFAGSTGYDANELAPLEETLDVESFLRDNWTVSEMFAIHATRPGCTLSPNCYVYI